MTAPDPVLSAQEVADELGVCLDTVWQHLRNGSLRGRKRGRLWFIRRSWLDDFLDEPTQPVSA